MEKVVDTVKSDPVPVLVPILVTKIGNTTIKFYDTYCKNITPEETRQIIQRIERLGVRALSRQINQQ